MLIAGYGSAGRRHVRNLQTLGCRDFVFYRTGRGTLPSDELAGWPVVASLDEAWSHRPRLTVIANPTAEHVKVALAAARAGCDLFIEKPLSDRLEGCDELLAEVSDRRLVAMIGCQFRFHPLLIRLREMLVAGELGAVIGARAEWGEYLPDWHPWEDHRQSYSARADLGGGVVLTLIHPLDYLHWLFGPVKQTQAATGRVAALQTPAGEDWAEVTLQFASGVIGQVHLDYWQRPPVHRLTVYGERGRADLNFHAGTLRWELGGKSGGPRNNEQTKFASVSEGFERNALFLDEMRHFLESVGDRREPSVTLADGIEVLKIALDAKQSAAEGRPHE